MNFEFASKITKERKVFIHANAGKPYQLRNSSGPNALMKYPGTLV